MRAPSPHATRASAAPPDPDWASARLFGVRGNPTRLGILELLLERPRTVSELIERLGCSPSRGSNHLACLRWCGVVEAERWGRTATYSIRDRRGGGGRGPPPPPAPPPPPPPPPPTPRRAPRGGSGAPAP